MSKPPSSRNQKPSLNPSDGFVLRIPREIHVCDACGKTQAFLYVDDGLQCAVCGRIKVWVRNKHPLLPPP